METTIKLERRIGDHLGDGNIDEINPSRREILKELLGAGVIAVTPFEYVLAQDREQIISDEARNRIWANYPEMQGAIDLINRGAFGGLIDYALYPNQGYSDPRGIPTSVRKIPRDDMDTPHYWLLLKIHEGRAYNLIANEFGDPGLGIPPPPYPPSGVWYFARGLRTGSPDNESDLLKALYIGATGSPQGAEPIINRTFMNVPGVEERAEEWRRSSPNPNALSDEGANHFAYLLMTLVDTNEEFIDRELVDLSLGILPEFYADTISPNSEKGLIYMSGIAFRLTREDRLARYHTLNENIIDFPLNPRFR